MLAASVVLHGVNILCSLLVCVCPCFYALHAFVSLH